MDPLSIVAGSTGTINFALSAAKQLYEFINAVSDAPAEVISLSRDVEALTQILETLDRWVNLGVIRIDAAASLTESLNACVISLSQLEILLRPFVKPLSDTPSLKRWKSSFTWTIKKKEVKDARERLLHGKTTLGVSIGIINTYATASGNEELKGHIEIGNQALRTDLAAISSHVRDRKEIKLANASHLSQRGSLFAGTDCGLPLRKYLEQLPPIDHPWSGVGDIEDILSLETFSFIDGDSLPPSPSLRPVHATPSGSRLRKFEVMNPLDFKFEATTPLSRAMQEGNIRQMMDLLNEGADPNQPMQLGQTCLHSCAQRDDHVLAEILLLKGANPLALDDMGRSALDLALMRCSTRAAQILIRYGADMHDFVRYMSKNSNFYGLGSFESIIVPLLRAIADEGDEKLQDSFIAILEDLLPSKRRDLRELLKMCKLDIDLPDEEETDQDDVDDPVNVHWVNISSDENSAPGMESEAKSETTTSFTNTVGRPKVEPAAQAASEQRLYLDYEADLDFTTSVWSQLVDKALPQYPPPTPQYPPQAPQYPPQAQEGEQKFCTALRDAETQQALPRSPLMLSQDSFSTAVPGARNGLKLDTFSVDVDTPRT